MNTTSQRTLSSEAEQEGAFRKAFIRSILASDTAVKKFTDNIRKILKATQPTTLYDMLRKALAGLQSSGA
ncbi:hypothetical protein Pmani_004389 [Petrolisthes manimaculis]|uniref:Uncharacterized protein n=1 Tax=Petrolisthes manimaculis TaxID=1843537 RepID=A0AAE1UIK3_9EUCA|nr:hypothetical protein Pmani_004389 [Petrolisthes manimaculis]